MKVKITQSMSGTHCVRNAGDECDLPTEKALRFIAAGVAVALDSKELERELAKQEKAIERQAKQEKTTDNPEGEKATEV